MEMNQVTTYQSPLTGNVYTVAAIPQSRAAWDENGVKYNREYTQYDIYLGDRKVQFAFDEEGIAKSVAHYEGVSDGWYCLARD